MTRAYISATFEDLRECRAAVQSALSQLEMNYRTMEVYVAEGRAPLERCLEDVAGCDLYIGIFAWRYGYRPPGHTKSITHLEYEHAVHLGKQCLIFLLDEDALWPVKYVDRGADAAAVADLRKTVARDHLCSFFTNDENLALQVVAAVTRYLSHAVPEPALPPGPVPGEGLDDESRERYFERLRQQYGDLDLDALSENQPDGYARAQLSSVFVEPYVRAEQPPELPRPLRHELDATVRGRGAVAEDPEVADLVRFYTAYQNRPLQLVLDVLPGVEQQRFVLLGEPGAGKSAVVRYLALALTWERPDDRLRHLAGHLPILVEVRLYAAAYSSGECRTFLDYLARRADTDGYQHEPEALRNHLSRNEPAVVIFDGLDEILDARVRDDIAGQIAAFAGTFPRARIIVTSRLAEYQRRILSGAGFAHYTLQDFDSRHTSEFLDRWFRLTQPDRPVEAARRRDLVGAAIRQSRELTELAGNPMLLSILAIIGQHRMLPKHRWQLYNQAANALVERWDNIRHLDDRVPGAAFVDAEDKREVLRQLAYAMQFGLDGLNAGYVGREQLKRRLADYLEDHYNLRTTAAVEAAVVVIGQLRERSFILSRYTDGGYGFVHRTFLEFFCAWAIVRKVQHTSEWSFERVVQLFQERWHDPAWREVLRLVAGELHAPLAADLVRFLVTGAYPEWPPRTTAAQDPPPPPWNVALAVQCLAVIRPLSQTGRAVELTLHHIIKVIDYCARAQDPAAIALLGEEILPAIEAIGPQWPARQAQTYLAWYAEYGCRLVVNPAASYAARVAAMMASQEDRIDEVLTDLMDTADDVRVVCAAVAGLGELVRRSYRGEYRVDVTLAKRRLIETASGDRADPRAVVRLAAARALGAVAGTDPKIHAVLLQMVLKESFADARLAAVQALGDRFHADRETDDVLLGLLHENRHTAVRVAAVQVLTRDRQIRTPVETALLTAVRGDDDAEVVELAARALLPRRAVTDQVRRVLAERLGDDPAGGVRRVAVRLLGQFGHEPELVERVRRDPDGAVVREAAGVLGARVDGPYTALCGALVDRWESEPDEVIRLVVVRMLNEVCQTDRRTDQVLAVAAQHDSAPAVRLAAAEALSSRSPGDRGRAVFGHIVTHDSSAQVRLVAVQALSRDPDLAATAILARVPMVDTDMRVRAAATRGLAGRDLDETVGRRLVELTAARHHPQIRLAAVEALEESRPRGIDLVAVFQDRTTSDTVGEVFAAAAVAALAHSGGAAELWPIIAARAADDPNPQVRSAAVALLASAAGFAGAQEIIQDRLRRDGDTEVVVAAAQAGLALGMDEVPRLLIPRLDDADAHLRCTIIRLLAARLATDEEGRDAVLRQARTENREVRRAAVEALTVVADLPEVRAVLAERTDDTDHFVRATAKRLLGGRPGDAV
ncbi:HEAT repeat domain-containing protein [Actinoplanes utahensis]|uniref:NACHT domain-containing protein n=1 Tax=Actinoplanes utahensis TaxID=1869 RepID=A0A0A6UC82_ACTUT|nr:HEAT repeat domain-containing protein [Actinoplanes utahensis]KHD73096.1 hypothetical protein MB27_36265 [Actinoplanes utahensis]GIF34285.1 hypothetical protein Aut01nite_72710 [Actinoplanes utahensis]